MSQSAYRLFDHARSLWWRLLLTVASIFIVVNGTAGTGFWAISLGLGAMWSHDLWKWVRTRRAPTASGR